MLFGVSPNPDCRSLAPPNPTRRGLAREQAPEIGTPYRGLRAVPPHPTPTAPAPYQPYRENQDIAFPCLPHFPTYSRTFLLLGGMCGPGPAPPRVTMPHYRFSPRSKKYFVGQFVVRISYLGSCPPWVAAAKRATDENLPRVELNAPPCRDIKAPSLRILTIKEMLAQKTLLHRNVCGVNIDRGESAGS